MGDSTDSGYQLLTNIDPDFTGNIDFSSEPDLFAAKRNLHIQAVASATNGTRGDSIASDVSNVTAAAFVAPLFITILSNDRGSMQGVTAVIVLSEDVDTVDVYCEAGAICGQVHAARTGAYIAGAELGVRITDGYPCRANGLSVGVIEENTLADYAVSGMSANWQDTGSRGIWLWNLAAGGPPYEPTGTGILIEGDYQRAAIYVRPIDAATLILISDSIGTVAPWFSINGLGTMVWSTQDGVTSSAQIAHAGVNDQLALTGRLDVTDVFQALSDVNITGDVVIGGEVTVGTDLAVVGTLDVGATVTVTAGINATGNIACSGVLFTGGSLYVAGVAQFADRLQFVSGTTFGTVATAGGAPALPATPEGYILMLGPAGATLRVPYYNT